MGNQLIIPPSHPVTQFNKPLPAPRSGVPLGTARWHVLTAKERYRRERGDVLLGFSPDGEAIGFGDDRHVLIVSGTRGGKGVSFLVPNLVVWPGSALIIDPKGENAMVTARRRGQGSAYARGMGRTVHILDPYGEVAVPGEDFSGYRKCFNPMDLLGPQEAESVTIAGRIADSLVQVERTSEPHWEESARTLIKDLILHVASWRDYPAAERHLVSVRRLLRGGDRSREELARLLEDDDKAISGYELLFDAMDRNKAFGGVVSEGGGYYLDQLRNAPRTLAGVISTAARALDFLDDPQMRACVSRSDFRLSDLKTDPKGVSIYVCLPQRMAGTHYGWLRMFAALTIGEMERTKGRPACGHPVLMVLDEFPALRRMRVIEDAAAQIAGFGVKMVFVAQTLAQLKEVYRDNWETMVANAGVKVFFGNEDNFTCEYVSKLIGDTETVRTTYSGSESKGWSETFSVSASAGESSSSTSGSSVSTALSGRGGGQSFNDSYTFGQSQGVTAGRTSGRSGSRTQGFSESVHKRPLVTPDEVRRLFGSSDKQHALVLVAGQNPFVVRRLEYFHHIGWRGFYDRHKDHPAPMTLAALSTLAEDEKRAAAERAEKQRREAAEKRHQQIRAEEARLAALLREQERSARRRREERLEDWMDLLVWMPLWALGGGGAGILFTMAVKALFY